MALLDVVRVLWSRAIFIIAWTLALALAGYGASLALTPIFRAEVLATPVLEDRSPFGALSAQFGSFAELTGLLPQGSRAAAVATLKSRSLTEEFLAEKNLLPLLFESEWNAQEKRWKSDDPNKVPAMWDAYRLFDRDIRKLQEDRKTGLVILAIEWRDPVAAAEWANDLVRRANARLQKDSIEEGQKVITYLERQLALGSRAVEVQRALYSLIEAETKKIAVAHAREEFGFKVIDDAVPPKRRIRPSRKLMALTGLILGLMGSSLWVLVRYTLKDARAT